MVMIVKMVNACKKVFAGWASNLRRNIFFGATMDGQATQEMNRKAFDEGIYIRQRNW
jgi:hypothetical protein